MVKSLSLDENGVKKGAWSKDKDNKLRAYINKYGHWNWRLLPKFAGLSRTGKSCRLRWVNYLRPNVKHGNFTKEEDHIIVDLQKKLGNKWSAMAAKLPGRSDNEIKNRWNTQLKKQAQDVSTTLESEHHKTLEPNHVNTNEYLVQELQKEEATNLASESSSPSSTVTELSSFWLSGLGCANSSIVAS
ncbi:transcription factor MYB14-like [Bidens hawaiensis]|uniref:transcription factor MYB14-like n=1 Tax=Bidens hawaiensis TaxID=980011 RepID=UPI00404B2F08